MTRAELVEKMARDMRDAWRVRNNLTGFTTEWSDIDDDERAEAIDNATAALAAIEAAGCAVVPKQPTREMEQAGIDALSGLFTPLGWWFDMLAASPLAQEPRDAG